MVKVPFRRCVACRKSSPKKKLLRFVLVEKVFTFDREKRLPGRGAYLHPQWQCWSGMTRLEIWERAFRTKRSSQWSAEVGQCMEEVRELLPSVSTTAASEVRPRQKGKVRL